MTYKDIDPPDWLTNRVSVPAGTVIDHDFIRREVNRHPIGIDPRVTTEADAERRRLAGLPERNSSHPNPDKPTPEEWGQSAPAPLEALPKPPARAQKALQWLRGGNVVLQQGPRK